MRAFALACASALTLAALGTRLNARPSGVVGCAGVAVLMGGGVVAAIIAR